jgi:FkbH-like protein
MTSRVQTIISQLREDPSWRGFQEASQHINGLKTRAEARALAQSVDGSDFSERADFGTRSIRVAVVGSFTTTNLYDPLLLQFLDRGLFCKQYHGPFGQLSQEIRNPGSGLYRHQPDIVVMLGTHADRLSPKDDWTASMADRLVDSILEEVEILRKRFVGPIVIQNYAPPEARPLGILDSKQDLGVADFYRYLNFTLSQKCKAQSALYVLDAAYLASFCGLEWTSLHNGLFLAGCSIPEELTILLAKEIAAVGAALKGFSKKCLVVDLDNTLWGGVVGEDGVGNIAVGGSFPGNLYLALQQQILSLYKRGVILAINSKNNPADVWELFENRSEMVLQPKYFSSIKINWTDKITNLKEIAHDLNIGLDSLVVLDDSAVERHLISMALPEVYLVPAEDPLHMLRFLSTCRLFDTLTFSIEDSLRAQSYAAAAERDRRSSEAEDLEQFFYSLDLVVDIDKPGPAQIGRVAQLTQKTNQFNLTTRRYSDVEIARLLRSSDWEVFYCSCKDKFADEGLIGSAFVRKENNGSIWTVDSFLMSCRALGRGVEQAFLSWICSKAYEESAQVVRGVFIPTKKNQQVENFFHDQGFRAIEAKRDHSLWEMSLPPPSTMWPRWITLKTDLEEQRISAAEAY